MMRHLAVLLCLAGPAAAQTPPLFVEETASSGLIATYSGDWEYIVGGGVAAFDCSGDGRDDLLIAGGVNPATFWINASPLGGPLAFTKADSGLEMDAVTGAYPLDIDSDGVMDVVLLRVGENAVMRGLGNCTFENANAAWGFDGGDGWSTAFAALWEPGAAFPTIAIGNYINRLEEAFPWGSCTDNWLHRGAAAGFAAPLPLTPSFCALSMLFTDWNRSGTPSLRVSNDREYYKGGQEQLWKILPGADPVLFTDTEGWARLRIWGMGIASHDVTGDGYPDYFLTSMADNKLQVLAPPAQGAPAQGAAVQGAAVQGAAAPVPRYADIAWAKGMTAHRPYIGGDLRPSTGWHAQFEDVNNDGLADLFVAKGNVWDMPDFARDDPNNLLVAGGPEGKFVEMGAVAGVASMQAARGAALADFNLDGLVDLVVVNRHAPVQVWRNTTPDAGGWVQVTLAQPAPNIDAIGAWIEVRMGDAVQRREITSGGGHGSGANGWWHFGLGLAALAEVRVIWPDGTQGPWQKVRANAFYTLERGAEPRAWTPH